MPLKPITKKSGLELTFKLSEKSSNSINNLANYTILFEGLLVSLKEKHPLVKA